MSRGNGKNPIQNPRRGVGRNPTLIPGNPGNRGGQPGRSGRKTNAFAAECARLTDDVVLPKVQKYLEKAKVEPNDPTWKWCAEYVTGYGKGKPTQNVGSDPDAPVVIRIERETPYLNARDED